MIMTKDDLVSITQEAGKKTLAYFGTVLDISYKSDNSPLTQADLASHNFLVKKLTELAPGIPIISEESPIPDYAERKDTPAFWIIDPLDGTKEFVKAVPEYTVNVALIQGGQPVLGAVGIPASGNIYVAVKGEGSYRYEADGTVTKLDRCRQGGSMDGIQFVTSRSHVGPKESELIAHLGAPEPLRAGSAVKFCLVAEGKADIYVRHLPIMEWDTAAGDLVLRECGGMSNDWHGRTIAYNKEDVRHAGLIASRDAATGQHILKAISELGISAPF